MARERQRDLVPELRELERQHNPVGLEKGEITDTGAVGHQTDPTKRPRLRFGRSSVRLRSRECR